MSQQPCCLTHILAGVGTISWPGVQDPPQETCPRDPTRTSVGSIIWPKVQNRKHIVAESADSASSHQLPNVQAIRLGPPPPPVDFDACRVNDQVLDAGLCQVPRQPEAISASFKATQDSRPLREAESLFRYSQFLLQRYLVPCTDGAQPRRLAQPCGETPLPLSVAQIKRQMQSTLRAILCPAGR